MCKVTSSYTDTLEMVGRLEIPCVIRFSVEAAIIKG